MSSADALPSPDEDLVVSVSRAAARALRHEPGRFGLTLDPEGWVPFDALLAGLRASRRHFVELPRETLLDALRPRSGKDRFEIDHAGRVRARYGHSGAAAVHLAPATPPAILWHGTSPRALEGIQREGLRPMRRQRVHLSSDMATALRVGRRHARHPVVLVVDAQAAHSAGVSFAPAGDGTWVADPIPARFLRVHDGATG